MADNRRGARTQARRLIGVVAASVLLAVVASPAWGQDIKSELDAAKARLEEIKREVAAEQTQLEQLSIEAGRLASKVDAAQAKFEQITEELRTTRAELNEARARYLEVRDQLNARAREAYINGPGNNLEFLLGATSLADLTDRITYVDALSQADADLANEVQNLKNALSAKAREEERLQGLAADALAAREADYAALEAKFAEQQAIVDDIEAKKAEAEQLVQKLGRQYRDYLESLSGVQFFDGVFKVCPVDQPRAAYDGFGAPRYAGGYHPHAGNDIIAPQGTPIRAVFDGVASASSSSLGGYAVYVYGSQGYVYNAHLMQPGISGPVNAGDVIGYVGNTGDAQGGPTHDHFEWHPNAIPDTWPASPYGYTVIGTALNPWPLLQQVC